MINRTAVLFDRVIVAVMDNANKKTLFSAEERAGFIKKSAAGLCNVEVCIFSGLLTNFFIKSGSDVIIRGLRNAGEFEHESQYAQAYKKADNKIETLFVPSMPEHAFISSGMAKEAAFFGGDLHLLLPGVIIDDVNEKFFGRAVDGYNT